MHTGQGDRLWIVKPGENSNRGNGITIYSDFDKMREWVAGEISGDNNPKKTFIIQKYIDKPLLYHKRKFDIRCYMLLARLVHICLFRTDKSKDTGMRKGTLELVAMSINWATHRMSSFI